MLIIKMLDIYLPKRNIINYYVSNTQWIIYLMITRFLSSCTATPSFLIKNNTAKCQVYGGGKRNAE